MIYQETLKLFGNKNMTFDVCAWKGDMNFDIKTIKSVNNDCVFVFRELNVMPGLIR